MFNTKLCIQFLLWLITIFLFCVLKYTNTQMFFFFYNVHLQDIFSLLLLITTVLTLLICLFIIDNKYFLKNKILFIIFILFITFMLGLVTSTNTISFFIFYELLLVPAYFLIKKSSPNRRSDIVSNYFLLWTQFGSFLVLLGLFMFVYQNNNQNFLNFIFLKPSFLIQILIFLGFGVKIPLWPFHFWLSKTHVEANTGFSIFLSGILVKAAIFGIYKFLPIFNENLWIFITIVIISSVDASLKMCTQIDLKKLVAFSTIQEMALMTFILISPSYYNYQILFAFVIFHTFISALFFWIVDCIYRRYNTRVVSNISGLSNLFPNLSLCTLVGVYLFVGVPFTIKFSIEFFIFKNLLNYSFFLLSIIIFFAIYLGTLFFFKIFITINFGANPQINGVDLSKKELFIMLFFIIPILLMNFI